MSSHCQGLQVLEPRDGERSMGRARNREVLDTESEWGTVSLRSFLPSGKKISAEAPEEGLD